MRKLLISYLPDVLKDVLEFQIMMGTGQTAANRFNKAVDDLLNDQFIDTATETGISRYESILGIVPKDTYTLDERRFTIKAKINEQRPFTLRMLKKQLEILCGEGGYNVELKNDEYLLIVKIELIAKNSFNDVIDMIGRVIPANMLTEITLMYNRYRKLSGFTHRELMMYRQNELRNEVLSNGRQ